MTPQSDDRGGAGGPSTRRTFIKRAGAAAAAVAGPRPAARRAARPTPTGGGSTSGAAATPGPGRPAARPPRPPGDAADLRRQHGDRVRPEAGDGPAAVLQLDRSTSTPTSSSRSRRSTASRSRSARSTRSTRRSPSSRAGAVQYDVFVPEPVFIERLVVGKILQPLNLSYVPNLQAERLAVARRARGTTSAAATRSRTRSTRPGSAGARTSCPGFDPATLPNPWSALWIQGPKISGKVGLLDDQHEGLAMGLLHNGVTDLNTENPAQLTRRARRRSPSSSRAPT